MTVGKGEVAPGQDFALCRDAVQKRQDLPRCLQAQVDLLTARRLAEKRAEKGSEKTLA